MVSVLTALCALTACSAEPLGKHDGYANAVAFSPDGKTVASAGHVDKTVRVWDVATGKELHKLPGHGTGAMSVCFAPDGKALAAAGMEQALRIWDPATGKELMRLDAPHHAYAVTYSPDGKRLASCGVDRTVRAWDAASGKLLFQATGHAGRVWGVAYSPDGKRLASGGEDGSVRVWDAESGRELLTLTGHEGGVVPVVFSPDGSVIASGGADKAIRLWDAATGKERGRLGGHDGLVNGLAYSPDGRTLASAGFEDKTVRLWETATGKEVRRFDGHTGPVTGVAFAPDGRSLASAGQDGAVRLWDAVGEAAKPAEKDLDGLWKKLQGDDAKAAYDAGWAMSGAAREAVPFLAKHLRAARDDADETKRIAALIRELDDDTFGVREKASEQLAKLGRKAEAALRKALESETSAEVRTRAKALLDRMDGPVTSPEVVPFIRAVGVLERIGTTEARDLLGELAKGEADAPLTREAKASLKRLDQKRPK